MLSSEIKALIISAVDFFSTAPLTQTLINAGIEKLIEAKNVLQNSNNKSQKNPIYLFDAFLEEKEENYKYGMFEKITFNISLGGTDYKISNLIEIPSDISVLYFDHPPNCDAFPSQAAVFYDENENILLKCTSNIYTDKKYNLDENNCMVEVPNGSKYLRVSSGYKTNLMSVYYFSDTEENNEFIKESNECYTVNTVEDMKQLNFLKEGDSVITNGYYFEGDNGGAIYDIVSYKEYYYSLPKDIRIMRKTIGITKYLVANIIDEYGNHTLNNGLIAKLRTNNTTPEQWGAKGDGITDDVLAFTHMAAHIKTGTITFGKNKTYVLGIIKDTTGKAIDNPYKSTMVGDMLGQQEYYKPIFGNVNNLKIDGNGSSLVIKDNSFGITGMGMLNFSGDINNLEIFNINFDSKGRTISFTNKNSNHTIFYSPSTINIYSNAFSKIHPLFNIETNTWRNGFIKNLNIHHCNFFDAGAMHRTAGDYGGDFILLIPPSEMENIYIENNSFKAWGRWVFAIDLGGNGERIYNVKFRNNICIGNNATKDDGSYMIETPSNLINNAENTWRWRALGLIDFETKKCFSNVEVTDNYIIGTGGFAINGASQVSNNIIISNNYWEHIGGGYPYLIEFYSGSAEEWYIEDNNFVNGGSIKLGITSRNIYIKNNIGSIKCTMYSMYDDIVFENNKRNNNSMNYDKLVMLYKGEYIREDIANRNVNFIFKNNENGIDGGYAWNESYVNFDISNNTFPYIDMINFNHLVFNPSQFLSEDENRKLRLYGFKATEPIPFKTTCGLYFEEGSTVYESVKGFGVIRGNFYRSKDFFTDTDITKGGNIFNFGSYIANMGYKDCKMVCTVSGIIPMENKYGSYGYQDYGTDFTYTDVGCYIYTEDNLYYVVDKGLKGTLGDKPTHTSGEELCGECLLRYIDKIAKVKLVEVI